MLHLQSISEIKHTNMVIVMVRFLIMACEILIVWANLLWFVNREMEICSGNKWSAAVFSPSEAAGIDPAGGVGLDGLLGLANLAVAVSCVFATFSCSRIQMMISTSEKFLDICFYINSVLLKSK